MMLNKGGWGEGNKQMHTITFWQNSSSYCNPLHNLTQQQYTQLILVIQLTALNYLSMTEKKISVIYGSKVQVWSVRRSARLDAVCT